MLERLFNAYQVADLLGVSASEVARWIQQGQLPVERIDGGSVRISERSLTQFLRSKGIDIESLFAQTVMKEGGVEEAPPAKPASPQTAEVLDADIESLQAREADTPLSQPVSLPSQGTYVKVVTPAASQDSPELIEPPAEPSPAESSPSAAKDPSQQVVEAILRDAVTRQAENFVLESTAAGLSLRVRVDGVMQDKANFRLRLPRTLGPQVAERFLSMAGLGESAGLQEGQFSFWVEGKECQFRLSSCPMVEGRRLAIRLLPPPPRLTLGELGLEVADHAALWRLLSRRAGLIVLAAPSGCGKSTTLSAIAGELGSGGADVVAVGAPRQAAIVGASNIRMKDASVAEMISMVVAQRPDAILAPSVQEIAAVRAAVTAASETLVLLALPACDFAEAMTMLSEAGLSPWTLSADLLAVIAQRKVRTLCPHCKGEAVSDADLVVRLGLAPQDVSFATFSGAGCNACSKTGYLGQTGIFSVTMNDMAMSAALRQNRPIVDLEALAQRQGTLRAAALAKVRQGATSLLELRRAMPL